MSYWTLSESKVSGLPLRQVGTHFLKVQHSKNRQAKQKICANLDHQTNWVCSSGTQRYCKNDSNSSLWLLLESRHFVESSHHFYQRDSSRVRVIINCDSSRVSDSSHAITARPTWYAGFQTTHMAHDPNELGSTPKVRGERVTAPVARSSLPADRTGGDKCSSHFRRSHW